MKYTISFVNCDNIRSTSDITESSIDRAIDKFLTDIDESVVIVDVEEINESNSH